MQITQPVDLLSLVVYSLNSIMKKDLHPTTYRPVVFQDLNNNQTYLTRSTVATDDKITLEGVEYPLVKVHISGSSHPFFTGEERIVDIEGRVDKFKARAAAGEAAKERRAAAAQKLVKRQAAKADKAADKQADK
jgi:large subunit ribosomal protein L31